jgi:hypothetical protein
VQPRRRAGAGLSARRPELDLRSAVAATQSGGGAVDGARPWSATPDRGARQERGRVLRLLVWRRQAGRGHGCRQLSNFWGSVQGKAAYCKRKWIAEPPNGWIQRVLGFRRFSLRGLHWVQTEFKRVCLALNLRRMGNLRATAGQSEGGADGCTPAQTGMPAKVVRARQVR